MRRAIAILVFFLTVPTHAMAGAWLRADGETFLSVETALRHGGNGPDAETDFYLDYGLGANVSIGLSAFQSGARSGHVTGFVRLPVGPRTGKARMAVQFDLGAHNRQAAWRPMYKLTFAYGRPFKWGAGYGWMNVEAAIERRIGLSDPYLKLEATVGQSTGRKLRPMVKIGATHIAGQPLIWTASANLLIDGPKDITWVVGIERKRAGTSGTALRLGLWRRF